MQLVVTRREQVGISIWSLAVYGGNLYLDECRGVFIAGKPYRYIAKDSYQRLYGRWYETELEARKAVAEILKERVLESEKARINLLNLVRLNSHALEELCSLTASEPVSSPSTPTATSGPRRPSGLPRSEAQSVR